jgi:hypothetical protein
MSRSQPAPVVLLRKLSLCVLAMLLVLGAANAGAQCHPQDEEVETSPHPMPTFPPEKPPVLEEPILPEAGFLSDSHYTSQFFGFSLDLPLTVHGHEIMMPVMPEGEHALLALQFEKDQQHGYIMIAARDPKPGLDVKTPEQQLDPQLRMWAQTGGPNGLVPQFPIPDYMLHSGRFYYSLRHKDGNFSAQYWTAINNYVVKVVIVTNDKEFLARAKKVMREVRFYCTEDDGTLTTTDGKPVKMEGEPYEGPTVPTLRVNKAILQQPAKDIPSGEVSGGVYHNREIGLRYTLPKEWQPLPVNNSDPMPDDASREYRFLHACSETLLRVAPRPPTGKSYAGGPMIVLRALDYNCFSLRTPLTLGDKRALDEVAAALERTGEFGQIDTDQIRMLSDQLFMVFHGTYGTDPRSEELSRRMSQTIYATRFNKLVLVWSLLAPTSTELERIPTGGILLEGQSAIELQPVLRAQN